MESAIDIESPRAAAALALVDARFKAILSLKGIIVNVYDEPISCDLWEEMRGCGWTIEGTWEEPESVDLMMRRTTTGGITIIMRM